MAFSKNFNHFAPSVRSLTTRRKEAWRGVFRVGTVHLQANIMTAGFYTRLWWASITSFYGLGDFLSLSLLICKLSWLENMTSRPPLLLQSVVPTWSTTCGWLHRSQETWDALVCSRMEFDLLKFCSDKEKEISIVFILKGPGVSKFRGLKSHHPVQALSDSYQLDFMPAFLLASLQPELKIC